MENQSLKRVLLNGEEISTVVIFRGAMLQAKLRAQLEKSLLRNRKFAVQPDFSPLLPSQTAIIKNFSTPSHRSTTQKPG